jgi:hypothetical protein
MTLLRARQPCIYCEQLTRSADKICSDCYDEDPFEGTELTAADELAFARYQERADFDYWHKDEK